MSGYLKIPFELHIPELEVLMADVQHVLEEVRGLKTDLAARFDAIDGVIDDLRQQVASGQLDAAALDQLESEVQSARAQVDSVDPEDPSGDDATVDAPPADGGTPLDPATGEPADGSAPAGGTA